MATNYQLLF